MAVPVGCDSEFRSCFFLFIRMNPRMRRARMAITPAPAPIPAFAPVPRPPEPLLLGADVAGGFVVCTEGTAVSVLVGPYFINEYDVQISPVRITYNNCREVRILYWLQLLERKPLSGPWWRGTNIRTHSHQRIRFLL